MKTPNYILTEDHSYGNYSESKVIKSGSFVRPIELCYVPAHCVKSPDARFFDKDRDVFCYTPQAGIIPIPRRRIREV